jgi:hypothetical protein
MTGWMLTYLSVCLVGLFRRTWQWKSVSNVLLLGACGPPGGGRQEMSARITRPFTLLAVAPPDEGSMRSVCSSILTGFLDHYFTPGRCYSIPFDCPACMPWPAC